MSGNDMHDLNGAKILLKLGELSGKVDTMHEGVNSNIRAIREDIARLEAASNTQMARVEDNLTRQMTAQGEALGKRIDGVEKAVGDKVTSLGTRVTALEQEDKKMIERVAKLSAFGGGVGGALAAGVVELIKHIPH